MKKLAFYILLGSLLLGFSSPNHIQEPAELKDLIQELKKDRRGPYKDIRWFCPDGSINLPKVYCNQPGGIQHARLKDEVEVLGKRQHIFWGEILAAADRTEFWDKDNNNSRIKQYQLTKYLQRIDDGWILRKGQYYRGAFQVEDEEAWGIDFLKRLIFSDDLLQKKYFLVRQAAKDIPHKGEKYRTEQVWAVSKYINDCYPDFMELRVKIHGQPDEKDVQRVIDFKNEHLMELSDDLLEKFDELINHMELLYAPSNLKTLRKYLIHLKPHTSLRKSLDDYVRTFANDPPSAAKLMATAERLQEIREKMTTISGRTGRLALLDISIALEEMFYVEIASWQPDSLDELLDKICYTGLAASGTGFLEPWEWEALEGQLTLPLDGHFYLEDLLTHLEAARRLVEWGSQMPRATYQDVVELYNSFEPLAEGFYDERVRNSSLLALGEDVARLGKFVNKRSGLATQLMNLEDKSGVRGLNPGYAIGELVVVDKTVVDMAVDDKKIYVFNRPPVDLKPISGIAS
ncbi:MAG: phosphoenolpyruvate synthase, partial [Saprospiraceae bacterium]|nr:phosphoenolpyruvate synthase [Saprospiraceae bacterium]